VSPDIEVIPLRDAIESVMERFERTLDGRRVETNVPDDVPPVLADATYLEQVIANLIENAARYSPREAPINVTAASVGRGVDICVEDGGPGVSDEDLGRIFQRFFRAQGRGTGSGTGLGLALVKGLVETMNGSVSAARSSLGGLAVRVHLPAAEPPR
jgi:two-component system sensor histidine kinase KdpD